MKTILKKILAILIALPIAVPVNLIRIVGSLLVFIGSKLVKCSIYDKQLRKLGRWAGFI